MSDSECRRADIKAWEKLGKGGRRPELAGRDGEGRVPVGVGKRLGGQEW